MDHMTSWHIFWLFFVALLLVLLQTEAAKTRGCRVKQRDGRYFVVCPQGSSNPNSERTITKRRGTRGKKGEQGKVGAPGSPGPVGPPGKTGEFGQDGDDGAPGAMGPKGQTGERGYPGLAGIKGEMGSPGLFGPQGPPGLPGNCLKVTASDLKPNMVHCLAGPTGPQGPTGKNGRVGKPGPEGEKGEPGSPGLQGPQGSRGMAGLPGLPGTLGRIMCRRKYSKWVTIDDYQSGSYEVGCNVAEFLQSFALETDKSKVRYRFHCCGFN